MLTLIETVLGLILVVFLTSLFWFVSPWFIPVGWGLIGGAAWVQFKYFPYLNSPAAPPKH
jgi:hypothetical protein